MSGHQYSSPSPSLGSPSSSRRNTTSFAEAETHSSPASSRSREAVASRGSVRRKNRSNGFLLDPFAKLSRLSSNKKRASSASKGKEEVSLKEQHPDQNADAKVVQASNLPAVGQAQLETSTSHDASEAGDAERVDEKLGSIHTPQTGANGAPVDAQARWKTDPNTLVNLALQLSQSRARVASTRLGAPPGVNNLNNRVISLNSAQTHNNGLDSRTKHAAGHSGSHVPATVPVPVPVPVLTPTATTSVGGGGGGGLAVPGVGITNGLGTQHKDSAGPGITTDLDSPAAVQFLPSPQTTVRAERAKIALELRYHHRRLLQYMPALPVTKAKKSRLAGPKGDDGQILRLPPGGGLVYNPLQSVRNRKTRYREQQAIDAEAQGWKDLDRVKEWVDEVARSNHGGAKDPHVRPGLPDFEAVVLPSAARLSVDGRPSFDGEEPWQTRSRVPPPRNDWTVTPWDLLADTYWLNQAGNRWLIQDRNGERIFADQGVRSEKHVDQRRSRQPAVQRQHAQHRNSGGAPINGRPTSGSDVLVGHETDVGSSPLNDGGSAIPSDRVEEKQRGSRRFSKRFSRSHALSSSSEAPSEEGQSKFRPWSGTFGKRWQGSNLPSEKPGSSLGFTNRDETNNVRSSSEMPTSHRDSRESRRPFSFDLQPPLPEESNPDGGDSGDKAQHRPASTLSDLDSTGPDSPALFGAFPTNFLDPKTKKGFKHAQKPSVSTIDTGSRYHRIQRTDFADDPFNDDEASFRQTKTNDSRLDFPLSSPSETSFSAMSDDQMGVQQRERGRHHGRGTATPERELGFHPLKPWKGGTIVGRARDLLRRKDVGSDTSDTGEESGRAKGRSPLSRATTSSSYHHDAVPTAEESPEQTMDNAQYKGPELPTFRSARQNGSPVSRDRKRPSLANWQKPSDGSGTRMDSDQRLKLRTRPESVAAAAAGILPPAMSRTATEERSNGSSASQTHSAGPRRGTNERRGATVTDTSGNQWPLKHRTDAPPWPGQNRGGLDPNIIWTGPELRPTKKDAVSFRDINRAKIILLATRHKTNYVTRFYNTPPKAPSALFREILTYEPDQKALSRAEEPMVLSHLLASEFEERSNALERSIRDFTAKTQPSLDDGYHKLKDHIQETLMDKVLAAGDGADNLGAQIAGECTLEVKHLNDRIDLLWRQRRRRSRWLRRVLFTMLEWMLLSIMWGLWFLVVCFKVVRGTVKGTVASVRWLFWM